MRINSELNKNFKIIRNLNNKKFRKYFFYIDFNFFLLRNFNLIISLLLDIFKYILNK